MLELSKFRVMIPIDEQSEYVLGYVDGRPMVCHLVSMIVGLNLDSFDGICFFSNSKSRLDLVSYLYPEYDTRLLFSGCDVDVLGREFGFVGDYVWVDPSYAFLRCDTLLDVFSNYDRYVFGCGVFKVVCDSSCDALEFVLSKEEDVRVCDYDSFMSLVAYKFFDYKRRELLLYERYYGAISLGLGECNVLLGDSRCVGLEVTGFSNLAQGGITLTSLYNILVSCDISKIRKLIVCVGINDLLLGRGVLYVVERYVRLLYLFRYVEVVVVLNFYTLNRVGVNPLEISDVNQRLKFIVRRCLNIRVVECEELNDCYGQLNVKYSEDGLHLNEYGQEVFEGFINKCI